ncbi:hypothetical protein [Rhodococcus koreensis]|uniref:hypothetical protein n=1 Tax=Rhodococcus koreensis TaxID=99653 RepID=UPI00197D9CA0|nr:hypothetical protein [Rhodococcus koreensis]QSE81349.1 hypothetical protein JWS14_20445 [Rhodococcus koreensis]
MSSTSLRIASFNVENLFSRPRAMGSAPDDDGRDILEAHAQLGELIAQDTYTDDDKKLILDLLVALDLDRSDTTTYAVLRQVHGRLVKRSKAAVSVVADGRGDWVGWVELTKERIDALAMTHTAQVLREVDADIAAVVEVEGRIALERFAEAAIVDQDRNPLFPHAMVIDGNDDRGLLSESCRRTPIRCGASARTLTTAPRPVDRSSAATAPSSPSTSRAPARWPARR